MENVLEYFLLTDSEVRVVIVGVGADVDDAVHVKVQVVELRDLVLLDHFTEAGVALTEPAVELGDTHLEVNITWLTLTMILQFIYKYIPQCDNPHCCLPTSLCLACNIACNALQCKIWCNLLSSPHHPMQLCHFLM